MQTTAFLGTAHIHTPGFINMINKRDDVKVKAVYDHDAARAAANAEKLNTQIAGSAQQILDDPEITSVIIASETARHLELVEAAAAAGKHIFAEKPLAINADAARQMANAIQKAGVTFQTGFMLRSTPHMQFIKQEIDRGNLGKITRMRVANCHNGVQRGLFDDEWKWIADATQAGGGGFADLGAHSLDILLWTLLPVCGKVQKAVASLGSGFGRYGDIDEYGVGILSFENGAIGELAASWTDAKLRAPVEVHGTEGEILVQGTDVYYYSKKVEGADGEIWTDLPAQQPHAFNLFWDKLEGKPMNIDLVSVEEAATGSI
jgi:predicted dehydrogenase